MSCLVSFIIPIYNREEFIAECLDSIIKISDSEYEIILVDDNSTDKSVNICESYEKKYSFIKLIRLNENVGPGEARNIALSKCNGKFVWFVDSDDVIDGEQAEKIFDLLNNESEIICFNYDLLYSNGNKKTVATFKNNEKLDRDTYLQKYPTCLTFPIWCWICNYSFLKDNNIKFPKTNFVEDAAFSCQIFLKANCIQTINKSIYSYRYFSGNSLIKTASYTVMLNGITTFVEKLKSLIKITNTNYEKQAIEYSFYAMATRLFILTENRSNNKYNKSDLEVSFTEMFCKYEIEEIGYLFFYKLLEKIKKVSLDFSKDIFLAPSGKFALEFAKRLLDKEGIRVKFIDNNANNSPYAQNAKKEGFEVYNASDIIAAISNKFVVALIHTPLAVIELSTQFEKMGLIKNVDFVCAID